ncbi:NACHT, LRR and PYD domains-containing protein 1b allele 2-like [Oreochromis niloticus]|uniref:NACHT, LRR and PYD domains-containing protein 1b allele 2-like n=1 Tax=Oreochromis niloticus TaxID=8128 RepID=UPI000DF24D38|nr:NACHT, LRR and PYD domains-containing protein 1b allele 2-like [Oreochromis niloticus]
MERMESRQYMPAGPLMDVTVTAGKLNEVHLPHWICIDDIPDILDMFAVVHIDDCGDVVEKVSEVTPTHVKLTEPIFSPRAVLMKVGVPVKINCNVLIYQTNTAFLTLHVYLIPRDPGLQQTMDRREVSGGYKVIRKPHPEKSLKMFHPKSRFGWCRNLSSSMLNLLMNLCKISKYISLFKLYEFIIIRFLSLSRKISYRFFLTFFSFFNRC